MVKSAMGRFGIYLLGVIINVAIVAIIAGVYSVVFKWIFDRWPTGPEFFIMSTAVLGLMSKSGD